MKRLICFLRGHDWWNYDYEWEGHKASMHFMSVDLSPDPRLPLPARHGDVDFCPRCGKLKWRPRPAKTLSWAGRFFENDTGDDLE